MGITSLSFSFSPSLSLCLSFFSFLSFYPWLDSSADPMTVPASSSTLPQMETLHVYGTPHYVMMWRPVFDLCESFHLPGGFFLFVPSQNLVYAYV